jgi:SagB-type dehydrogenase family enzyme
MSSEWGEWLAAEPQEETCYFFWASLAYHRGSSFFQFPHPPQTDSVKQPACAPLPNDKLIALGAPSDAALSRPFIELLRERCSDRNFGDKPLTLNQLSTALWSTYGTKASPDAGLRRVVPSGGQRYSLRLIVRVCAVDGLESGLYEYISEHHALGRLLQQPEASLADWFITQHIDYSKAAAVIFLSGRINLVGDSYGERGYRYMMFEAGHAGQNLSLAATSMRIPSVPVGGFVDDLVNQAFKLTEHERVLYSIVLGLGRRDD